MLIYNNFLCIFIESCINGFNYFGYGYSYLLKIDPFLIFSFYF